ncbi:SpoIIE family protein phosphatase [Mycobacterium botniense]|uniref:Serine phosphatase n=1 Tax=Mycobacterium botniense TaxID=84962 RepID=A0A7I9XWG5_9MYCO|nr:SpoIIE family protein phosphatase [Mycobacterium botniense]GFG74129.1 serine phosphatase [Mycobacterium botniense]
MREHGRIGPIEWAGATRSLPGEQACGDYVIALDVGGQAALFAGLDGLGHGEEAETAALCAVEVLKHARAEPLEAMIELCHRALMSTRGAAMTLARIDFESDMLSWIGVGNVTANLIAKAPSGVAIRSATPLASGIVGFRMPDTVVARNVAIRPGDLLVIASDGISEGHLDSVDFAASAVAISDQVLGKHAKDTDDASVLAARHRGASP